MPTASKPKYGRQPSTNHATTHIISGAITTAATPVVKHGKGFTVATPGTGRYVITITGGMGRILSAVGILRKAAGSATFLSGPTYVSTEDTVEFRIENAAGAAAAASAVTDQIDFVIVCCWDKEPV